MWGSISCGSICIPLMIFYVSIFSCAVDYLYRYRFYFGKISMQVISSFLNGLFICLLWVIVLCIFCILLPWQIYHFLFFPLSHGLPFTLLLCPLIIRNKFTNLMRSNIYIYFFLLVSYLRNHCQIQCQSFFPYVFF